MNIVTFLILVGATYRLSNLLVAQIEAEHGPYGLLDKLRHFVGVRFDEHSKPYGTNELAELFCCIYCLSFWIGLVIGVSYLLVPVYATYLCLPFALSGGAIVIKHYAQ